MTEWAKYAIIAVKYDKNDTHIIEVQRYEYDKKENKLIKKEVRSRSAIIEAIEKKGLTYTTATKTEDGYWEVGEEVHVTTVDGKKYLRTDSNKTTKDNLGELPEF